MKFFRICLICLIIVSSFILFAQKEKSSQNCIYFDINYLHSYLKSDPQYNRHSYIFMINYYRTLIEIESFELKSKSGFGFYTKSPGETNGLYPSLNLNLGLIGYLGSETHKGYFGIIVSDVPYYYSVLGLIVPIGYEFNYSSKFSVNFSFNQYIAQINIGKKKEVSENFQKTQWIWNSYSNKFLLNIGIGYHF